MQRHVASVFFLSFVVRSDCLSNGRAFHSIHLWRDQSFFTAAATDAKQRPGFQIAERRTKNWMQRHVASVSSVFSVAKNLRNPKSLAYSLPAVAGHYLAELLC